VRWLVGSLLCVALISCSASPWQFPGNRHQDSEHGLSARQQILGADGQLLGFSDRRRVPLANGGYETSVRRELLLQEEGAPRRRLVDSIVTTEDAAGDVQTIQRRYALGRRGSVINASIADGRALVSRTTRQDVRTAVLALPDDLVFDGGAAALRAWVPNTPVALSFSTLDINAPAVRRVVITEPEVSDAAAARTLVRRIYQILPDREVLLGSTTLRFDAEGEWLSASQASFGSGYRREPLAAGAVLQLSGQSLVRRSLVKSPVRIPLAARKGRVRYTLHYAGAEKFVLPVTGEQGLRATADGVIVDVCANCGPGLPTDAEYLRDVAQKLMRTIDFTGHVSALEAIQSRRGDCTEAALLVATFGRDLGIPTKVASGIVYSRERYHGQSNTFMPHAWALAYVDGKWRSFDSALGEFDSTRLVFTVADGDPQTLSAGHRLAGMVSFAEIVEVRKRLTR